MIYAYSLPAILAFLAKAVMLIYWRQEAVRDIRHRLFLFAVVVAMSLNIIEFTGLQGYWGERLFYAGYIYYGLLLAVFAILAHFAVYVAYEQPPMRLLGWLVPLVYGYLLALWGLLAGSDLLVNGFEILGGYTITRIPGPLYPMLEFFCVATLGMIFALPIRGLGQNVDARLRARCQIWMLAAAPASLVVITVLSLLRLNIKLFTASVTLPIPMTLLLLAVGYCVHNKRIVDLSIYVPLTKRRYRKRELHASLRAWAANTSDTSVVEVLGRLASTIGCPVSLVDINGVVATTKGYNIDLSDLSLPSVQQTVVTREADRALKQKLAQRQIGAIIPLFSTSSAARLWLIFGNTFDAHFYSPADFELLDRVIQRLAGLLLDQFDLLSFRRVLSTAPTSDSGRRGAIDEPLPPQSSSLSDRLTAYEAFLVAEALKACGGNKAKAARTLGLQPNTLHYKLKRLGL